MTYTDLFWHFFGFLSPAFGMAVAMVLVARMTRLRPRGRLRWLAVLAINFAAGALVLVLGLVLTGQDGKMASYGALVLVSAACQAVLTRPGKRRAA